MISLFRNIRGSSIMHVLLGLFPNELKLADVLPVFKKDDDLNKENYRHASILSHMSKVFERIFYKQIDRLITSKCSPFLCGFRKTHNSQYLLLKMIAVWKKILIKKMKLLLFLWSFQKLFIQQIIVYF